ncbi:S8 family serine peptidase [Solwaraspora sp. WMMD792]|uniref:S8 family serine peptidase n=1 Tax=Solwaraspora sp. WMMD792 TaxID=3016099 RepID=UPI0024161BD5|nr:S8 family serine peptidase [Solwaraspora sp. WMMD792]MDG4771176.1 S8 family serine peptidase [Solwaraspora sp. WMMD792]
MTRSKRLAAAGLAAVLVIGPGQPGRAAPTDGASAGRTSVGQQPAGQRTTVTLITGDQVTVTGNGAAALRPGEGRDGMQFRTYRIDGDLHVVPSDAAELVQRGTLDSRLFNVTKLIEWGYHDAARNNLPLIVTAAPGDTATRSVAALAADGLDVQRDLPAIDGAAVTADKSTITDLWSTVSGGPAARGADTGVERIWLDGKRQMLLDRSVAQIGAPAAHQAGFTGAGVTVGVMDSGVDTGHPDLTDVVIETRNFTDAPEEGDTTGHGTHVASIIAGSGAASGGKYQGVAPDAKIISAKVCPAAWCDDSAMIDAMHWFAVDKQVPVVNISIGGGDGPEIDPLEEAVNTLTEQTGTLFVIAAGNSGAERTVGSPGSADAALTVGAVDRDGTLADFSSRGPRVGDDAVKPDITAPGVDIVAARAEGTTLDIPIDEHYVSAPGTSMSAPHVTGAVALLAQQQQEWTADQFKSTLMGSAAPHPGTGAYQQGAGLVDVARAVTQTVTAAPASISYGRAAWPHQDDEPITRSVTYRNTGTEPVTLDLTWEITGPAGASVPAGMFTTSAAQVEVPAGGTASVDATADTRVDAADGYYSGQLVATAGQTRVVTPVGVHREVESYDVTLSHIGADGDPSESYWTVLAGLNLPYFDYPYDEDGTVVTRLPKGAYGLFAAIDAFDTEGRQTGSAILAQPRIIVTGETTVTLDARQAAPVQATVPQPAARAAIVDVTVGFDTVDGPVGIGSAYPGFDGLSTRQIGGDEPAPGFSSAISHQWFKPDPDGGYANSPFAYALSEVFDGRLPTGYQRDYATDDLARVRQDFRGTPTGDVSDRLLVAEFDDPALGALSEVTVVPVPGERIEWFSTDQVAWFSDLYFSNHLGEDGWLEPVSFLFDPARAYAPEGRHTDTWNLPPFGPAMPATTVPRGWVSRIGDEIVAEVPLFGDAAGHAGDSQTVTARTALYRDGELVDEWEVGGFGYFVVPPGQAGYRLETSATRDAGDLATEVDMAWTFQSGRVNGDEWRRLPVMVARPAPPVDEAGTAPAGEQVDIPVTVRRQTGVTVNLDALSVDVSYDGGTTWLPAPVRADGRNWVATVQHPDSDGYVSLRFGAEDRQGNTFTQTVLHAYRLAAAD